MNSQDVTALAGFVGRLSKHREYRPENPSNENINHFRLAADHEAGENQMFREIQRSMRICMNMEVCDSK